MEQVAEDSPPRVSDISLVDLADSSQDELLAADIEAYWTRTGARRTRESPLAASSRASRAGDASAARAARVCGAPVDVAGLYRAVCSFGGASGALQPPWGAVLALTRHACRGARAATAADALQTFHGAGLGSVVLSPQSCPVARGENATSLPPSAPASSLLHFRLCPFSPVSLTRIHSPVSGGVRGVPRRRPRVPPALPPVQSRRRAPPRVRRARAAGVGRGVEAVRELRRVAAPRLRGGRAHLRALLRLRPTRALLLPLLRPPRRAYRDAAAGGAAAGGVVAPPRRGGGTPRVPPAPLRLLPRLRRRVPPVRAPPVRRDRRCGRGVHRARPAFVRRARSFILLLPLAGPGCPLPGLRA